MLATQPPLEVLNLRCDSMGGFFGGIKVTSANGMGIKLRDIVETAAEFYRTRGQDPKHGFLFDAEMTIYQPLHVERPKNAPLVYYAEGRRRRADEDESVGFQRAWKTKLRCNLG